MSKNKVDDTTVKEVYIMGGLRTAIGKVHGQFKGARPDQLGAAVINGIVEKYKLPYVDEVICGNAVGPGGNIGRLMTLQTTLPDSTPACTVDMQCASAGASVEFAFAKLRAGMSSIILAGGTESSSLQPTRCYAKGDIYTGNYMVAQFSPEENDAQAMLKGAERVAQKYAVTKEELDRWSLLSHRRAAEVAKQELLKEIILPCDNCMADESIRPQLNQRLLDRMPPLFGEGGLTTIGNSCLTHDGAAFVAMTTDLVLAVHSNKKHVAVDKIGVSDTLHSNPKQLFKIKACTSWGGTPAVSPEGAWHASELLLKQENLSMEDMDAIEWNEAFAVIDVLFERAHPHLIERYNPIGGALAYGHPYGASGAIILLHLLHDLEYNRGRYGICAIAGAGGMGTAILIERIEL